MWVRSSYASGLAALLAWLCALMPWSVTVLRDAGFTAVIFWFVPGNLLFTPGLDLPAGFSRPVWVWHMPGFFEVSAQTYAAYAWLFGALLLGVTIAYSTAYYLLTDRFEAGPVDPLRMVGGLLVGSGLAHAIALVLFWQSHPGLTMPVGVLFLLGFGALLFRLERIEAAETDHTVDHE